MLEFDSTTKRFGALAALDGCTFAAWPGRLTGFLGPNGAGKTTAMRAVFGLVELDAGTVRWHGAPSWSRRAGAVRLHARGAGPLSAHASAGAAALPRPAVSGRTSSDGGRIVDDVARAARPRRPGERPPRRPVARQPAAGPADRRAGQRARPARARRAVLRAGPDRHGRHGRAARRGRGAGADRAVLQPPARPGRGPVRGRRHHRPRPRRAGRRAGRAAGCRAAAVRRHPLPRAGAGLVEAGCDGGPRGEGRQARLRVDRDADLAAVVAAARSSGESSRSPTNHRHCPSCSAGRSRHERRAADVAGRPPRDPRAKSLRVASGSGWSSRWSSSWA